MIGTTIRHRYKIIEKVGGGGMAEVFKAYDHVLDHEVAVKILRSQYIHDEDFIKRFRREAESVASLFHENVVDIYDLGEEKDLYYIVMEYIEGMTLKELIQKKGTLSVDEALDIAEKICSALEHAHQNHIIHRDIKPQNILIGKNGIVKVTDFGIARAASSATITYTGSVMGSVHYLSPEQARGGYTDEKADLYSLGVVLYEMMTGKLPFLGDSPITVALKHLQDDFTFPREINPDIPQSIENVILKALVKDPTKRYASAKEMLHDLQTALLPERVNEPRIQLQSEEDDEERTMIISSMGMNGRIKRREKKNTWNKGIIFAVLTVLLLSFIILSVQAIGEKWVVPDVEVPDFTGKPEEEAIGQLKELGLTYKLEEQYHESVKEGEVIKQIPNHSSVIKKNQVVTLYVSLGKQKVEMPDLTNMQERQATFFLSQQKFIKFEVIKTYDESAPIGQVFKQEPQPKTMVIPGEEKIILFVSKGKEKFEMPNLIGKTQAEAEAELTIRDLSLGKIDKDYSFEQPEGRVFRQFPFDPGREVTAGDQVDITVSLGYPKEAKTIYGDILIRLDEDEEAEISIVIRDSREQDIVWKKEKIKGTQFYDQIGLILMPQEQGSIIIYKNGELYQTKPVQYY